MGNSLAKEIASRKGINNATTTSAASTNKEYRNRDVVPAGGGGGGARPIPKDFILLNGCTTLEEHEARIHWVAATISGHCNHTNGRTSKTRGLQGEEGLHAIGFEYRFVPCSVHSEIYNENNASQLSSFEDEVAGNVKKIIIDNRSAEEEIALIEEPEKDDNTTDTTDSKREEINGESKIDSSSLAFNDEGNASSVEVLEASPRTVSWKASLSSVSNASNNHNYNNTSSQQINQKQQFQQQKLSQASFGASFNENDDENDFIPNCTSCHECGTRLFYVGTIPPPSSSLPTSSPSQTPLTPSNTSIFPQPQSPSIPGPSTQTSPAVMITPKNRQRYIANGQMYEILSNLAQQATHEYMRRTFHLDWVTICNKHNNVEDEPLRALVDKDHRLVYYCSNEKDEEKGGNDDGEDENGRVVLLDKSSSDIVGRSDKGGEGGDVTNVKEEKKGEEDHDNNNDGGDTGEQIQQIQQNEQPKQQSPPPTTTHPHLFQKQQTFHNRSKKGTLLIATGRGKVRAGIFSRQHLLTSGIEIGSAWHMIREARIRGMGVAIIDPNARGEGVGMETFQRSVSRLFLEDDDGGGSYDEQQQQLQTPQSLYILAHSASGGQLVRHLREDPALLPSIRAIAFTDSTHNVQWCKHDPKLVEMLQSKNCVYLRSNEVRSSGSHVRVSSRGKEIGGACAAAAAAASTSALFTSNDIRHIQKDSKYAGKQADTDHFWQHRFGKIKTLWAGTADHALSNWAGHDQIWDHFDEHASADGSVTSGNDDEGGAP